VRRASDRWLRTLGKSPGSVVVLAWRLRGENVNMTGSAPQVPDSVGGVYHFADVTVDLDGFELRRAGLAKHVEPRCSSRSGLSSSRARCRRWPWRVASPTGRPRLECSWDGHAVPSVIRPRDATTSKRPWLHTGVPEPKRTAVLPDLVGGRGPHGRVD
jgi:hypothetical protein